MFDNQLEIPDHLKNLIQTQNTWFDTEKGKDLMLSDFINILYVMLNAEGDLPVTAGSGEFPIPVKINTTFVVCKTLQTRDGIELIYDYPKQGDDTKKVVHICTGRD